MLAKVPLEFDNKKVVAISKHLCGAATGNFNNKMKLRIMTTM